MISDESPDFNIGVTENIFKTFGKILLFKERLKVKNRKYH